MFSLPENTIPDHNEKRIGRTIVGIGVLTYAGKYRVEDPSNRIYLEYLNNLVAFAGWLLAHGYDIRLQFQGLEKNAEKLKPVIRQRVEQSRKALDEQYKLILKVHE